MELQKRKGFSVLLDDIMAEEEDNLAYHKIYCISCLQTAKVIQLVLTNESSSVKHEEQSRE